MADKFKVLMIDDEKDIVTFLSKTFANFPNIQFLTALRAVQGIEIAKVEKPQVIMLDLRMPGMNGEEALGELKKILPECKFIVMTGWDDGATQERIEKIGVAAYFSKPVDLEKLVTKVINLVMTKN
jgi:DNA-binding NtrC family response regulator